MKLYVLQAAPWIKRRFEAPSRQELLKIIRFNLGVIVLILAVGGPLGDLRRMAINVWTLPYVLCSAEILCTVVSTMQLMGAAWVLREIYVLRRDQLRGQDDHAALLWGVMYVGFLFLALDEVACLHEGMARVIRWAGHMKMNWMTDRIDDIIPLVYAVIGLSVLVYFRKELARFRFVWPLVALGAVFVVGSVVFDVLTHRKDMLWWWLGRKRAPFWYAKFNAMEEGCKVMAEGIFLGMFQCCLETVRGMNPPTRNAVEEAPAPVRLAA